MTYRKIPPLLLFNDAEKNWRRHVQAENHERMAADSGRKLKTLSPRCIPGNASKKRLNL
jgi:hypothetical protein